MALVTAAPALLTAAGLPPVARPGFPLSLTADQTRAQVIGRAAMSALTDGGAAGTQHRLATATALWPLAWLAAINDTRGILPNDVGDWTGPGPLAEWADAMDTLATADDKGLHPAARRVAQRTAEQTGPAALAEGRALWEQLHTNVRQLAASNPTSAATAAPERSASWR
jgi:hypothetical protein